MSDYDAEPLPEPEPVVSEAVSSEAEEEPVPVEEEEEPEEEPAPVEEDPEFIKKNNLKLDYEFYITNQIMNPVKQVLDLEMEEKETSKIFEK